MFIDDLVRDCHKISNDKGWNKQKRSALEFHMLFVTEIAEATECVRNNEATIWCNFHSQKVCMGSPEFEAAIRDGSKPEGEAIEVADLLIRVFDYCGVRDWDIKKALQMKMDYNVGRDYRHGGKAY